jgi:hypothetical protein
LAKATPRTRPADDARQHAEARRASPDLVERGEAAGLQDRLQHADLEAAAEKHRQLRAEMEKPIRPSIEAPTVPSRGRMMSARRRARPPRSGSGYSMATAIACCPLALE